MNWLLEHKKLTVNMKNDGIKISVDVRDDHWTVVIDKRMYTIDNPEEIWEPKCIKLKWLAYNDECDQ